MTLIPGLKTGKPIILNPIRKKIELEPPPVGGWGIHTGSQLDNPKPAVSPLAKSAGRRIWATLAGLETRDTADWEVALQDGQ